MSVSPPGVAGLLGRLWHGLRTQARRLSAWLREDDGTWTRGAPRHFLLFLLLFGAAMFLVSLFGDQGLFAYRSLRGEAVSLRDEVGALKIKQQDLGREIRLLRGDPATIERLARERLGLVKAGEIVIQLPPPKAARD